MRHIIILAFSLLWWGGESCATNPSPSSSNMICFRYHAQWKVSPQERRQLQQKYGMVCLSFDSEGKVQVHNLPRTLQARFFNLYNQCMKDGCVFCDASEGSCEDGTCGANNACCKPYMEDGLPICGEECGYYALQQL